MTVQYLGKPSSALKLKILIKPITTRPKSDLYIHRKISDLAHFFLTTESYINKLDFLD